MAPKLFESDSEASEAEIKVREDYAKSYENWRRKEEIQKLKDKYGDNVISSASEPSSESDADDSESEDEEPIEENVFDDEFFKVYGALKSKDPVIYNKDIVFFEDPKNAEESISRKKISNEKKPKMTLLDYQKNLLESRHGITDEDQEEDLQKGKTIVRELQDIKNEFKKVIDETDQGGDLIVKNCRSTSNSVTNIANDFDKRKDFLSSYWKNTNLDKKEKFLKSYVLDKKYLEPEKVKNIISVGEERVPQIFDNSSEIFAVKEIGRDLERFEDSSTDPKESEPSIVKKIIQNAPSHRYLEEDGDVIKRYSRIVESVRDMKDGAIKAEKRLEKKKRKKKEKEDNLHKLRQLKRAEIKEKLEKIATISGNKKLINSNIDIDTLVDDLNDFNPDEYDKKMQSLFGDDYYQDKSNQDLKKPVFDFISGIDDDLELNNTDGNEAIEDDISGNAKKKRKEHKKNDLTKKKKNIGIYEDILGDQPTRFKYRKVPPNDFGLTAQELLLADDKELNKWASLKKTTQYRSPEEETYDQKVYARKKDNLFLKKKILKSLYKFEEETAGGDKK